MSDQPTQSTHAELMAFLDWLDDQVTQVQNRIEDDNQSTTWYSIGFHAAMSSARSKFLRVIAVKSEEKS